MTPRHLLPLLALVAACATPPPPPPPAPVVAPAPPPPPPHPCDAGAVRAAVAIQPDGTTVEVTPERGEYMMGRLVWRGHVDGDQRQDVLVRDKEACDAWGSCPYWLYVACADGAFAAAAHLPSAQEVRVTPAEDAAWSALTARLRVVSPQADQTRVEVWRLGPDGRYAPR